MAGRRDYGGEHEQPLLGSQYEGVFVPAPQRVRRNAPWTLVWATMYVATVILGVFSFLHRNTAMLEQTTPQYLNDPTHCPAMPSEEDSMRRRNLFGLNEEDDPFRMEQFLATSLFWILGSAVGALAVGVLFVFLVGWQPSFLVGLALGMQIGLPLLGGTTALLNGNTSGAIPLLILAGILALLFWLWREQLGLVTSLLGVSGKGLTENASLVPVVIVLQLVVMALTFPLLLTMIAAISNGRVAFNPDRSPSVDPAAAAQCVDDSGNAVICCVWQTESYVGPFLALCSLVLLWTCFIGGEVRTFIVSGTIAQWYFAPVSSFSAADDDGGGGASQRKGERTSSRVAKSVRAALGPSFGSLCLGGAILTMVSLLRSALEELRKRAESNVFLYCFFVLISFVYTLVEMVTKFATVRLAITGEGFMVASKNVVDLLHRNFLDAFGVWWLPPLILQMTCLVLSGLWSVLIYGASASAWNHVHQGQQYAACLAIISFVISWLVVSFFASLLLNVIDAVFICFAMDRDMQSCSRVEVHEIYSKLPSVGPVVQNPDGGYMYAAAPSSLGGGGRGEVI